MIRLTLFLAFSIYLVGQVSFAQKNKSKSESEIPAHFQSDAYKAMHWRFVGTHRGGRASGVCGVLGQPNVYYLAATGGGVWKTTDGGNSWQSISDGFFGGSVGAVRVSPSDPNIVYAGCGEKTVRGNVSPGYEGVYRSYDAGKTWESIGLAKMTQIGEIRVHPKDPNTVLVAVIGDLFKDSPERGLFKTTDGGKTWKKVLYVNSGAGAVDVTYDPNNPRILYAATWKLRRTPYSLSSGGEGSGLWKSTDGGDTWENISENKGLPHGPLGIIGVSVSGANSDRVFAIVEAKNGGLFRSDDAGKTWAKVSEDANLRQRAWYYSKVFADPINADRVYVMNVQFWRSDDGGKNFKSYRTPHGDHHDLWISPENNENLVVGDDGGAQVSFDAGENWTSYHNQATAQYYRITTDNAFPYRIYVAQQDNSTLRIPHRTAGRSIGEGDWESTAGGESAHLAPDPENPEVVYGGSYGGYLSRVDHSNDAFRLVDIWPDNPIGHGVEDFKYRFQWNFPIFFSPHDPDKLYAASNHLHVTTNEGQSWEVISPDLTRDEPEKQVSSGGPITQDNTGVEYYATIFAACESPYEEDLLWTASDDGRVNLSKDGGETWTEVTPPSAPKNLMWNSIDPDPFTKGGVYLAGTLYKAGDYRPYLFRSKDYGKTWVKIINGIPADHFTRVVRADPDRQGLLYAGTEFGVFISFDDGASWSSMQLDLPITPVTDMVVKDKNLAIATQGRGVYILDDLSVFHQLTSSVTEDVICLLKPTDAYRMGAFNGKRKPPKSAGENHHNGVQFFFNINQAISSEDTVTFELLEKDGSLIRKFSSKAEEKKDSLTAEEGSNSFVWDMRYPNAEGFPGMILWAGGLAGPKALPGEYKARLSMNGEQVETDFTILADPRSTSSIEDLKVQFDFVQQSNDKLSETHKAIKDIRAIRGQLKDLSARLEDDSVHQKIKDQIKSIQESMTAIEEALYQTKNKSGQDPLNYPIRLNNKLAAVKSEASYGDYRPTDQAIAVANEMTAMINAELDKWEALNTTEIKALNEMVLNAKIELIQVPKD